MTKSIKHRKDTTIMKITHTRNLWAIALIFILAATDQAASQGQPGVDGRTADRLLRHGRIYTANPKLPWAEALAMRAGNIIAVGSDRDIESYCSPQTEVIALDGRMAMPGIIDSHIHFLLASENRRWARLDGAQSVDEAWGV